MFRLLAECKGHGLVQNEFTGIINPGAKTLGAVFLFMLAIEMNSISTDHMFAYLNVPTPSL
jgi:hypothetical protein